MWPPHVRPCATVSEARRAIYATGFGRATATSLGGVLLGLHLARTVPADRAPLFEMDVPTRQSYVLAVVAPEERTVASGLTHLVRLAAWAVGPLFAGLLMGQGLFLPLVVGASMKITYDVMLWLSFRRLRPPEERAA